MNGSVLRWKLEPFWGVSVGLKVGSGVGGRRKLIMWDGVLTGRWLTVVRVASYAWCLGRMGLVVGCWVD